MATIPSTCQGKPVNYVVVDSGPFIRNAPIKDIADHVYSLEDVVNEIRDKATRTRLQVLPYTINFREPSGEAIKAVTEFSKKTGDYVSLSAIDMRVMAMAYQLHVQHVGKEHIRTQPDRKASFVTSTQHLEKPTDMAGFYLGGKKTPQSSRATSECTSEDLSAQIESVTITDTQNSQEDKSSCKVETDNKEGKTDSQITNTEHLEETTVDSPEPDLQKENQAPVAPDTSVATQCTTQVANDGETELNSEGDEEWEEEDSEEEDDDDDDGWITPQNVKSVRQAMGDHNAKEHARVEVACLTTDFAMQNVLIQMGLNVVSVDGYLIKQAKSYVLKCSACMKVTSNMVKIFCPWCGNKTLHKLSMTVNEDGSIQYFASKRKKMSQRGLRYSLPAPKGGKHSVQPILCEDQIPAQQRTSKAANLKYDVFDPDYVARNSPFAPIDVTSRAAQLGIRNHRSNFRKNPNEVKKKTGNKKKR